jgi:hypothetical protein
MFAAVLDLNLLPNMGLLQKSHWNGQPLEVMTEVVV